MMDVVWRRKECVFVGISGRGVEGYSGGAPWTCENGGNFSKSRSISSNSPVGGRKMDCQKFKGVE
jgi:hypothetical protein